MTPQSGAARARSLLDLATERGRALCSALGLAHRTDELLALISRMTRPWGTAPVAAEPEWSSHVVDDGTPFEFSVALGTRPELRFMVEPLGSPPSLRTNIATAQTLLAELARDYDLDLSCVQRVYDLFLPRRPQGSFGLWLAFGISSSGPPEFKLYLNPQASGSARAPQVIEEALVRLGFDGAWPVVGKVLAQRGPGLDELKYFSLDLSKTAGARVKVYARHHLSTPETLVSAASGCPSADPVLIRRFLAAVSPSTRELDGRGPFTCYAFVRGSVVPDSVTTHFPINGYAQNDEQVRGRVSACHAALGIDGRVYPRIVKAIANRPLADGIGLNSYVSFRHHRGEPRLTLYLPVEAYAPGTVENPLAERHTSGVVECISSSVELPMERHPFVARLQREGHAPAPLSALLWTIFFALERLPEELRAMKDELDAPDSSDLFRSLLEEPAERVLAHLESLSSVLASLEATQSAAIDAKVAETAVRFRDRLAESRRSGDLHERLGAALRCALFAAEARSIAGAGTSGPASLPRLSQPPEPSFPDWSLGGGLTQEADISLERGMHACSTALWTALNELYEICYGARGSETNR